MKDGLYFERAPSYCKNQHRMFIVDDGKIGEAGIIHFDFHRTGEQTQKIKKYLGMGTKNIIDREKMGRMFKRMQII